MSHRNPTSLRALLLLLLAIGPLQAQAVYACAMMDTVMHDACCCDDHDAIDDCVASQCDTALQSGEDPCCERSLELSVDQDSQQATPAGKAAEVRSDADPPQALVYSIDQVIRPRPAVTSGVSYFFPTAGHSGSDTYLTTQRLRI